MFEHTQNAMLIVSDDRVYVDCNAAAGALLECSREQIVGRRIEDFTPVELRGQVPAAWAAFLSSGASEGTYELITAKSRRIAVEYSATPNFMPGLHLSILMRKTEPVAAVRAGGRLAGARLSQREREILRHLAMGASGRQIAADLFISSETVRTHLRNILAKLGAQTRPHAVALALQHGEITAEEIDSSSL